MSGNVSFPEAAEQVKQQLDVLETVGKFVTLKKRGRSHLGLCPFHKEKSPSFNVAADKGFFKCFGCGESGDAISFLMKIENKTYGEVIREQADELGLSIRYSDNQEDQAKYAKKMEERERLWDVLKNAAQWFHSQLNVEHHFGIRDYLTNRGFNNEVIDRFHLGYGPESWDALTTYLLSASPHVSEDQSVLERASLAGARDSGGYYDKFRNRLMVPILDTRGRCIGFGGRALGDDQQPKYLNSSESLVYQKSEILYGFFQAKDAIRTNKYAVVMEGYFDVIASHMAGVEEAVATCGTALTEAHITLLLKSGVETLYLCFDSDKAGRNAALSAIERLDPWIQRQKLKIRVLRVPGGKDPDDYFKANTLDDFKDLMNHAPDALSFRFDCSLEGIDLHSADGQVEATQRLMPLLAKVKHPIVRAQLISRYGERLHLSEDAIRQSLSSFEGKMPYAQKKPFQQRASYQKGKDGQYIKGKPQPPPEDFTHLRQQLVVQQSLPALEQKLLTLALVNPDVFSGLKQSLFHLPWQSKILGWLWEQLYPKGYEDLHPYLDDLWQQAQSQNKQGIVQTVQGLLMQQELLKQQLEDDVLDKPQLLEMTNQCLHAWQKRYHQDMLNTRNTAFRKQERVVQTEDNEDETDTDGIMLHYDVLETQGRLLQIAPPSSRE